ncbi:MAG: hypothetical protein ACLPQY_05960 [Streptosporangiaceae bacterium]
MSMKASSPAGSSDGWRGGALRRPGLPRRQFLARAGAAGAAAFAASAGLGAPEALAATRASAPRRSGAATGMPSLPEVWNWEQQLVRFGTRYTGSSGHAAYVDWLAGQFSAIPGFTMRTDRLTFDRWLARDFALRVSVPSAIGHSGPVPLTYYYPYSGQTPPGGVTGPLVDLGAYPPASGYTTAFWAPARGAIALVRTAPPVFDLNAGQAALGGYQPGKTSGQAAADYTAYAAALTHPAWQGIFEPVPLLDARNAGVLGVVVTWTGLPDDEVINQYNPFTTGYPAASGLPAPGDPGCPAVWVGDSTGTELSGLAASGQASATLVLTADITVGAATETVWGSLKGSGDTGQNIVINTHTDGPNATEENGGLGLLALARHLAGLPSRNHDMYFALVTGHFQLPQFTQTIPNPKNTEIGNDATSVWMLDHPGIYQAAALGVTVEHLGATRWTNDPVTGQYVPTGGFDWGTTYTMQRDITSPANAEQEAYLAAVAGVNGSGWPDYPVATVRPAAAFPLYLGEGAPLYAAGLGTVSLCPLPTYLLQAGDAQRPQLLDLDKLDQRLMYGEILAFAQTIETLDAAQASAL